RTVGVRVAPEGGPSALSCHRITPVAIKSQRNAPGGKLAATLGDGATLCGGGVTATALAASRTPTSWRRVAQCRDATRRSSADLGGPVRGHSRMQARGGQRRTVATTAA